VIGGISGSGETIGHHTMSAAPNKTTCRTKWNGSDATDRSTIAGQCVNSRIPLKRTSATIGRVRRPNVRRTARRERNRRQSHDGIPATISGAATSV
jgi:hypothetical protein